MERALTLGARPPAFRIALARLLQSIGWAGIGGLCLLGLAAVVGRAAWRHEAQLQGAAATVQASPLSSAILPAAEPAQVTTKLPGRAEIPLLLTRIERAVTQSGLPWSTGDYRIVPATDRQAAALEVRCAFKAPYPKLRAMLVDLLGSVPAATFREMSFARANIHSPDVDARFAIVVFLADDLPAIGEGTR